MPARSVKQRKLMAIALHAPGKLYKRNRGVMKMDKMSMEEFARTSEKGLPKKKGKKKSRKKRR